MPPKAIFKGQTFAISGKLSQSKKEYEELIRKYGGEVSNSVTAAVTFLISNEDDVKACSTKVAMASGRGVPIVQEGFVGACVSAKKMLEPGFFAVKGAKKRKAAPKAEKKVAAKRVAVAKPKAEVSAAEGVAVIPKSGLEDKATVVKEDMSKGFMKGSLTWDVETVLHDPGAGKDRFYNLQLLGSKDGSEFWTVQNWGRTGMPGTVKVEGPFEDISDAKRIFKKKYRQKTGNVWGQLAGTFAEVAGKFKILSKDKPDAKPEAHGVWQYFMHNSVDGKKIAWYDYDESANENMEKYWRQCQNNSGLEVRLIQSDYFKYEVNFKDMIQTNTKSGTRRVIRRVPAGTRASSDPPAKIPEKVKPSAPPADESSDEEEEEDGEDEEDEPEEEEEGEVEEEAAEAAAEEEAEAEAEEEAEEPAAPSGGRAAKKMETDEETEETPAPGGGRAAAKAPADAPPARKPPPADAVADADAETLVMGEEDAAEALPVRRK